ncbi:MAG: DUF3237 domain-containing protein [Terracidiphilus sp.]|nr:DUF3237 domain-containing protein [Terracidiphilus sp.]
MPILPRHTAQLLLAILLASPLQHTHLHAQAAPDTSTPQMEFVFEEVVTLGPSIHPGETPFGERNIIPITGGTVSGQHIKGTILPGGWDWQLTTKSGCHRLQADYMIQTDDGVVINVLNKATMCDTKSSKPSRTVTTPVFEAPLGRYEWLNDGAYLGMLEGATVNGKPAVRIRIYRAR